ncbi:S9 family peptidase [Novosphingobium sp. FKTRR1]|uniref:alpha/beta hydrolase family protein n=1 Tax=Novosphingobium sp. FKTRR1 TaxID=2879118 RepID=UPI001CEFBA16|nr:S9 family peptidase [Novosphingobium sp. FKTRR1]
MKTSSIRVTRLSFAALCIALAAPLVSSVAVQAAEVPAPFSPQDLVTLPRLGGVAVSPDGALAAWVVTTTDPASYARTTALWIKAAGAPAFAVALEGAADSPAFAPDGSLYLLSDRKDPAAPKGASATQLWKLSAPAKAATAPQWHRASAFAAEPAGFKLSPDGKRVVVWADLPRTCATFGGCADSAGRAQPGPGSGRLYRDGTGFVRHWDTWANPGTYSRLFAFALDAEGVATGNGQALDGDARAGGLVGDAPTKPYGDGAEIAWTRDSNAVIYAARLADRNEPRSTNVDLWLAPVDGAAPRNLTASNLATDTMPAVSPDGRWLAYAAMARPGYESDRLVVHLRDIKTGAVRALTGAWDRSVTSLAWTADGKALIATAEDVLDTPAFRIDPRSGKVERLTFNPGREGHIGNVVPLKDGRLGYTRDSIEAPAELFIGRPGKGSDKLTDIATSALAARAGVVTQRFHFAGAGGDIVWGQITKPVQAVADGKLPAILYVHGGPQGSFNDAWSNRWNPRVWAAQGYAVVAIDFHGSTGYGQAFTDAINRDWGGKPLEDLQKGLEAALALDPQIDGANACAAGASYGGYMMNWIEGRWPDRFKCIVQHDGVFDARAMAYETEEQWFDEWEHGGHAYHEAPDEYEKWNPVNYVTQWRTPMLVITSERDFRIPYTQGLAAFSALQRRGVPSDLLVFPDENHWVLKPKNSLQWHQTVFEWLDRWLKRGGKAG